MVKIRLTRAGAKKHPFYRVIAVDSRKARDSRPLEFLGTYDPNPKEAEVKLDLAGIDRWLGKGAQMSDTVRSLVKKNRKAAAA
jgi:small subunit ribosomal protein S16